MKYQTPQIEVIRLWDDDVRVSDTIVASGTSTSTNGDSTGVDDNLWN